MYPLHCFSPYNKGKACSRDSVSHSCNSLILRKKTVYPYTLFPLIIREKTVYPYTLFPLIIREETVYPYTLFPLIIREKTVYPYTLLMQTLNCILNCNLGTTASLTPGKNCVPLHSFDITVHCFQEEESLLKGYIHYTTLFSVISWRTVVCHM